MKRIDKIQSPFPVPCFVAGEKRPGSKREPSPLSCQYACHAGAAIQIPFSGLRRLGVVRGRRWPPWWLTALRNSRSRIFGRQITLMIGERLGPCSCSRAAASRWSPWWDCLAGEDGHHCQAQDRLERGLAGLYGLDFFWRAVGEDDIPLKLAQMASQSIYAPPWPQLISEQRYANVAHAKPFCS